MISFLAALLLSVSTDSIPARALTADHGGGSRAITETAALVVPGTEKTIVELSSLYGPVTHDTIPILYIVNSAEEWRRLIPHRASSGEKQADIEIDFTKSVGIAFSGMETGVGALPHLAACKKRKKSVTIDLVWRQDFPMLDMSARPWLLMAGPKGWFGDKITVKINDSLNPRYTVKRIGSKLPTQ
jgi:hypothetical protein